MTGLKQRIQESAAAIAKRIGAFRPEAGIILGTGLGSLGAEIQDRQAIPYGEIPHFARSTVDSHKGELVFGTLAGRRIAAMEGRFHFYEGYTLEQVTHPVRVMKALGATTLVVTNACGGMNPGWNVGDVMVIDDHINLLPGNPLIGPNDDELGPRFPDMSRPYDPRLIALAEQVALEERIQLRRGVFVAVPGPNLETRAEYRFLRAAGADVVGMSTVPEVIVAVHQGTRALGFSVITDSCLPDALEPAQIDKILAAAATAEPKLKRLVLGVLRKLD
jgi:purine-nucleoside phosphorylase